MSSPRNGSDFHAQQLQQQQPHSSPAHTQSYPHPPRSSSTGSSSPVAPAYSPITPKVQPVFPVNNGQPAFVPPSDNGGTFTFSVAEQHSSKQSPKTQPTQYISQPPNRSFSVADGTDAIALRAAISTLQFQKQKAREDIKTLANIKQLALDDPNHFKEELAAGTLKEERPKLGDLQAILDQNEDTDDDETELSGTAKIKAEDEATRPSQNEDSQASGLSVVIPGSQATGPTETHINTKSRPFPRIPGPQDVIRMPPVNWDKYHIVGDPLETLHEQQKRWPGSTAYGQEKGREHSIAAPYSPFLDQLDPTQSHISNDPRKDSAATASSPLTLSEHPMETRSRH